ncbi:MAG: hypothetical protein QXN59_02180 [Candidatus Micrarchaeaceae archaeon]
MDSTRRIADHENEKARYRKAYKKPIKAQSFDIARGILPAATMTNLG